MTENKIFFLKNRPPKPDHNVKFFLKKQLLFDIYNFCLNVKINIHLERILDSDTFIHHINNCLTDGLIYP